MSPLYKRQSKTAVVTRRLCAVKTELVLRYCAWCVSNVRVPVGFLRILIECVYGVPVLQIRLSSMRDRLGVTPSS